MSSPHSSSEAPIFATSNPTHSQTQLQHQLQIPGRSPHESPHEHLPCLPQPQQVRNQTNLSSHSMLINHHVPHPFAKTCAEKCEIHSSAQFPLTPPDTPLPLQTLQTSPALSHSPWRSSPPFVPSILPPSSDSDQGLKSGPTFQHYLYGPGRSNTEPVSGEVGSMVDAISTGARLNPNSEDACRQREQAAKMTTTASCQSACSSESPTAHSESNQSSLPTVREIRVSDEAALPQETPHDAIESTSTTRVTVWIDILLI
jgi:hypothetical protein